MRLLSQTWALFLLHTTSGFGPPALSYAALGDSYASGDGAGSSKLLPPFDVACGRFSDAYPVQFANNTQLKISHFHNLACGGASTQSLLLSQLPWMGDSEVVTLTVGGNEVDFFSLLNECVHQWHPFTMCETEMAKSRSLIESTAFLSRYADMILKIREKASPSARILVTGYSTFFNEETDQCSHVSFSKTKPDNLLTKTLRKKCNDIVRLLNNVIEAVCHTGNVEYINLDDIFSGHRFCEAGIEEPSSSPQTWFFNAPHDHGAQLFQTTARRLQQHIPQPIVDFLNFSRTFHPTSLGHAAIARGILAHLLETPKPNP